MILGIILLIPPVISVFLFLLNLYSNDPGDIATMNNLSNTWTGVIVTLVKVAAAVTPLQPHFI